MWLDYWAAHHEQKAKAGGGGEEYESDAGTFDALNQQLAQGQRPVEWETIDHIVAAQRSKRQDD